MIMILVRHGETDYTNHNDSGLTEKGVKQAKALALHFKNYKFDAIYSSDLLRARQTSEQISKYHDKNVRVSSSLREINRYFKTGEKDEFNRIRDYITALNEEDEKVLLVVHGHLIRFVLAEVIGIDFDKMSKIDIVPGSITIILRNKRSNKVATINSYMHIPVEYRSKR